MELTPATPVATPVPAADLSFAEINAALADDTAPATGSGGPLDRP
jgi:hypothetical protein